MPGGESCRAAPSVPSRGLLAGWTVSSPPSIACPVSSRALLPARRKAGRADSGSSVGLHTSCPTHRSTAPASLAAQSKQQRDGAEGRETEPQPGRHAEGTGCLPPSRVPSLPSSPGTSREPQISTAPPTQFQELVPEQEQGWQGEIRRLHCRS